MGYPDTLKNPLWQKKRLDILQRDNWTCVDCGVGLHDGKTFHVHHIKYEFGRKPWDYPDENFLTVCLDCHAERHKPLSQTKDKEGNDLNFESESMTAAFHVLYADLKQEISRMVYEDVEMEKQLYFIFYYQNVQVEDYLIWHSINASGNGRDYKTYLNNQSAHVGRPEPYESFCFKAYLGIKAGLTERVLEAIAKEDGEKIKNETDVENLRTVMRRVQKINTLRIKFNAYQKSQREMFAEMIRKDNALKVMPV